MGGHVSGGAFGFLCRQLGLAADYLHAVELVTVDAAGHAAIVVATRDPADPNFDLWWAHTGGGGGNFGVVLRYWFRASGAPGDVTESLAATRLLEPGMLREIGREAKRIASEIARTARSFALASTSTVTRIPSHSRGTSAGSM
jgi:FAD/FMN-containing dehydrogenase